MTMFALRRRCAARPQPGVPAGRVRIRSLERDDQALDAVFAGLSPRSRRLRFHAPVPRLTGAVRRRLLDVDGVDRVALVAEVPARLGWHPVGIARLVATEPRRAELAVEVVDSWQGCGVGRRLLGELGALAADLGYGELFGDVLPENEVVVRLLRRVFPGARVTRCDDIVRVICPLDRSVDLTDRDILADLLFR